MDLDSNIITYNKNKFDYYHFIYYIYKNFI